MERHGRIVWLDNVHVFYFARAGGLLGCLATWVRHRNRSAFRKSIAPQTACLSGWRLHRDDMALYGSGLEAIVEGGNEVRRRTKKKGSSG